MRVVIIPSILAFTLFVLIESGLLLFSIQLAWLVVTILTVDAGYDVDAYDLIVSIHQQLNVIR